ncbi:MAG: hypothetical protein LUD02_13770 [Tannerellaceae bacterium]|nr:hypothetical protein [Tannerellaceae bacterium]
MMLPRIQVDPVSNAVTVGGGEQVQLRINGTLASSQEVAMLLPQDILRIEFYDEPGLRYENVHAVLNYITRRNTTGGSVYADLINSPHIVMGRDQLAVKVNHRKSEFGFNYMFDYRNFTNYWRENNEIFAFSGDNVRGRKEEGKQGRYNRYAHDLSAQYSFQENDKRFLMLFLGWVIQ